MKHVVYGLTDPATKELRYVGYTSNLKQRLAHHFIPSNLVKKTHKNDWIKSVLANGCKPICIILETFDSASELPSAETELIEYYSWIGCSLTNGTKGGDGGATRTGQKNGELWRRRMTEVHKGKIMSEETRSKISLSKTNPSDEVRKTLSESHVGIKQSEETIRKRISKNIGRKRTPEQIVRIREGFAKAIVARKANNV